MAAIKQVIQNAVSGGSSGSNRAAYLDGKEQKLRVDASEYPTPGADQIVVQNHAVAVNPVDWKIQDSGMFVKSFPMVLGCDIAGEVQEVGSNVKTFKTGDRVTAHSYCLATQKAQDGGFQLYCSVDAASAAKIPDSLSYKEACVLPLAIDTAGHGLYDSQEKNYFGLPYPSLDPKPSGKTILVWGGSSSVGAITIQFAVASGCKVVAVASKRNHEFVKKLGASEALDYNDSSVVEHTVQATRSVGGEFLGVYDAISTEASYKHVLPILKELGGGILATTLPPPKELPEGIKAGNVFAINHEVLDPLWANYIPQALEQGKLKAVPEPMVVGKGLEHVQKGLDANKAGVSAKKVVIEL